MDDEDADLALARWVQQQMLETGIRARLFDAGGEMLVEGDISDGQDLVAENVADGVVVTEIEVLVGKDRVYRGSCDGLPVVGNGGDIILHGKNLARDARRMVEERTAILGKTP